MADVYLAISHGAMDVNRLVVIKRLREEHVNDDTTRAMFLDEARLAARLNHPNVIQTFEAGNENGSFFLAMEYVDGQPLSRVLTALKRSGKLLEPRLAARVCADFLSGLHYAHELTDYDGSPLEIVHRDVSPQNVMLSYEGAVKLVDFGIAKAAGTAQTAHGIFKGKVAFMAPEQVRAENVDRRADVFAAGIILWESVTGQHLMAESTPAATLYNLMSKAIPRASEVNPSIPATLDAIIGRALERNVADRYQTAKDMRDDLEAFIVASGGAQNDEIGRIVKELFADTREKVQAQIRSQLTTLALGRSGDSARPQSELGDTQIRQMNASSVSRLVALDEGYAEASSKASVFRVVTNAGHTATPTRRLALALWFFVPLLALAATTIVLARAQSGRAADASVPPPPPPVAFVTAPATASEPTPTASAAATPVESAAPTGSTPARPATAAIPTAPPRVTWVAPRPAAPVPTPAASATTTDPPKPTAAPAAPSKAPEPPQGRTFRRDL